jgi:Zn-dependent protease
MELARSPKREEQLVPARGQTSYDYTITYERPRLARKKVYFSVKELRHLAIAALLVIGIGLSSGIFPEVYGEIGGLSMVVWFAGILTASFFVHEIAHKVAAQRRGLWAEFRLTLFGAILTLISIISPIFKIISPGAVMVSGIVERDDLGKISIAGPATNIVLSVAFLAASLLPMQHSSILLFGAAFNAWIALFNLIPFGMLDGFKIFVWNKKVWASVFAGSLALTVVSYRLIF